MLKFREALAIGRSDWITGKMTNIGVLCDVVNMAEWGSCHWESACRGYPVWFARWTAVLTSLQVYGTTARL